VGFLFRVEEDFLAAGVGVAFSLAKDAQGVFFCAADGFCRETFAVGEPDAEQGSTGDEREDDAEKVAGYRWHA
jgi:hypothetical protein